jgi:hypothetical protein
MNMTLCSSVEDIFLSFNTEEYIIVIFLGSKEDKNTEKYTAFSCSEYWIFLDMFGFCMHCAHSVSVLI